MARVEVFPMVTPCKKPFKIATATYGSQPFVIVKVYADEGIVGYGKACPAYEFTGETASTVASIIGERLVHAVLRRGSIQHREDRGEDVRRDVEEGIREAVHPDVGIMVDANQERWRPKRAIKLVERYELELVEQPIA